MSARGFDYGRRFREIEQHMIVDATSRARRRRPRSAPPELVDRLADAMLEAKAGASGPFDGQEQRRRTRLMAEWIIARLPFHGLALIERADGLTDEQREARYREWLHRPL